MKTKTQSKNAGETPGVKNPQNRGTFVQLSRAWYGDSNLKSRNDSLVDDVCISVHDAAGNQAGAELIVQWINLRANEMPAAQLHAFHDAWPALAHVPDLIDALTKTHGANISPTEFCRLLESLGFQDATPTKPN